MKHSKKDYEELVQAALALADRLKSTTSLLPDSALLVEKAEKFRPKPPRVGVVEYYAGAYIAIELTHEVREALKVAGIEWSAN